MKKIIGTFLSVMLILQMLCIVPVSAEEVAKSTTIYAVDFESWGSKVTVSTPTKYGATGSDTSYVNNTLPTVYLRYEDVTFGKDADIATFTYGTGAPYDGERIRIILVDSATPKITDPSQLDTLKPVGEFVTADTGWAKVDGITLLDTPIEAGTYDVYLTFSDDQGGNSKTMDFCRVKFENIEDIDASTILGDTLRLTGANPASETISNFPGTIELTFDNYLDKDTIDISLEMSNGSPVKGRYIVDPGSGKYTRTVSIKHGYLEVGKTYVVNIGEGLKSLNGISYTGERQIEYRAESSRIFYEDFSGDEYVVDSPPPMDRGLTYMSKEVANDASDFTVLETEDGDKYLAGVAGALNTNTTVSYDFEPNLTNDAIAIEIGIKGYVKGSMGSGSADRDFIRVHNESNAYKALGWIKDGVVMGGSVSTPASDGFSYVKVIASKDANGYYVYDFYPDVNSSSYTRVEPMIQGTLSKVTLAHIYPVLETYVGSDGFAITSIDIYKISTPGVIGGTSGAVTKSDNEIDVYFDSDMDVDSLEAATYTLKDASGENSANVTFKSYDEETYTLTLSLEDYLLPEIAYTLSIEGAEDTTGTPMTNTEIFDIYLADGPNTPTSVEISEINEGGNVSATVKLPSGASVKYILILVDSTGRIRAAQTDMIVGATNTITMSVNGGVNVGDTAKLFLWEQISTDEYSPVKQPCIIKCE